MNLSCTLKKISLNNNMSINYTKHQKIGLREVTMISKYFPSIFIIISKQRYVKCWQLIYRSGTPRGCIFYKNIF